jgi:hypothetical protein
MEERRKLLIDYFKKNLAKGYNADTLKWALIKQGYSRTVVESALEAAQKETANKPKEPEKPKINYEIIDENDKPVIIKKPWWKRLFGL